MKKISTIALFAISVSAVLSSCISPMEMNEKTAGQVKLSAEIEDKYSTRVDDSGFCDGDSFGVFIVNFADANTPGTLVDQGNQADNVPFTFNAANNTWTSNKVVTYKDASTKVNIYGYYPYDAGVSNVHAYGFSVNTDQRKAPVANQMDGYEASDFLFGIVEGVVPSENTVSILFRHKMSSVSVTLTKGEGWASDDEWRSASKDVLIGNTVTNSVIDLETGTVTPTGDVSQLDIVPKQLDGDVWKAVVVPQVVPAGKELVIVTVNGLVSTFSKDVEYQYYQGKMNTITLSVSKKSPAEGIALELVAESIAPWEDDSAFERAAKDYIVIHCPEAGKLETVMAAGGYDLASIRNLKLTGEINAIDFYMMNTKMDNLEALNLADVTIGPYEKAVEDWVIPMANKRDCIPIAALQYKTSLHSLVLPNKLLEIGSWAFSGTNLRGTLVIPEGTVSVGGDAFSEITSLNASVVFPSTLQTLESGSFRNTTVRGELHLPVSLRYLGGDSFYGAPVSGHLYLPDSLEYIGGGAFSGCKGLTGSLIIPEKIKEIPVSCFEWCGFDGELVLNENLEGIGNYALQCHFTGPLVLPKSLNEIGSYAFYGNRFSSLVIESQNLKLGEAAFSGGSIQGGKLEIPEGITSIGQGAFSGGAFESVRFPKSLEYIGAGAFSGCYNITEMESESDTPPQLGTGAFDDVQKDNFTVVVPASSVDEYQTAPGWNEFKRIEAKRDFSISRRLYRTLNASSETVFTLRAESGASWSVQEKPDWVTVNPSSGTGKTEVRVSVAALPRGGASRSGQIVYRLGGDTYTVSTTVEQYDSPYADGDVLVNHAHTKGSGVRLIFMGDGYDAKDISEGKYASNINEAVGYLFAIEPYKSYKDYFDVSTVIACSEESGIQYANIIRDTKFKTTYTRNGMMTDEDICDEYALKASGALDEKTHIALICNTSSFTGKTYLYPGKRSVSICPVVGAAYPYDFRGVVQHEIGGHGIGKLGDERIDYYAFIQNFPAYYEQFIAAKSYGWYDNLSLTDDIKGVPWSHMIFDPDYSDVVDVYEGGFYFSRGVFRSESNSCMNNYVPYFSAISRESIVRRIMVYAGEPFSYESFKEKDQKSTNN